MSIEKKEKSSVKNLIFLGKKTESSSNFNNLFESNKCEICGISKNLFKCQKCPYNYCKECIKKTNNIDFIKSKENEFICQSCQNPENNKKRDDIFITCDICGNKFIENNIVNYDVNQEQKNIIRNDYINKEISLSEKEYNLSEHKLFLPLKICNNCLGENGEITDKITHKKNEQKKQNNNNIIDILMNAISKEKEETNIFNILDSKSENSSENNEKKSKSKIKEIDEKNMENEEQEKNNIKVKDKKEIKLDIKCEEKQNINNFKNNIENSKNFQFENIFGNNILNDNNLNNINNYIINKNSNEFSPDITPKNINDKELLNSNLLERNLNPFLMPQITQIPPSININSNNKTTKIYLPHFFTTNPLNNNQNINPFINNMNNSIPLSIIDMQNLNNNTHSINDNSLQNNKNQIINDKINLKSSNLPSNPISNNKFNSNMFSPKLPLEENKNIIPFLQNLNSANNLRNNISNYDINPNKLNNNYNNLNEGINKLMELGEQINMNNLGLNRNENNNIKKDFLFNSINNSRNTFNANTNINLIGINNEIKSSINKISKDLYSFDNNNIENNLNILTNIQIITDIFSQIVAKNKNNNSEENNNNKEFIKPNPNNNHLPSVDDINKENKINNENKSEEKKDNINNQQSSENINNINLNEIKDGNPSTKVLIKYILSVNESLRSQLKRLKMYIEIQKAFVSIIYQILEVFNQNLNQGQPHSQKSVSPNKDLTIQNNPNNILSQIKEISPQNNQNNLISQINSPSQMTLNTFNNLKNINQVNPSSSALLNSPNINYNSPILISPITQFLPNNNINRGLPLFHFPGQQFKQEFGSNIPNIFNGTPHFPLYPQQQGVNSIGNPILGQNISQMMPILNPMNPSENNIINNNLEPNKNSKNI